ncbi:hypothetical protein AGDE_10577 [Angomonas deanei]|uniref:Uncharacterized protein n=1 Tax=Angomonas deanei TaxID=59799 RepID=A0A7G2CNJ1_9TRYP|nr:hypothetical protein AGDE_10577 [Angomonas deanei]CAD2220909.1 hypothetical protein, conserved [Angomonas deanei]|eukprot:EPY28047.1 hypothetical protein AGDE_10577 [Angomonas deanei]
MMRTADLGWLMSHTSKSGQERILHLFNALYNSDTASEDNWDHLSSESISIILAFAVSQVRPRFLFAVGSNYSVLRSPDKGQSWKKVFSCVAEKEAQPKPTAQAEEDDELAEITGLMKDIESKTMGPPKKEDPPASIEWLATSGAVVVGGGVRRYVCASGDRGVTFATAAGVLDNHLPPTARVEGGVLDGESTLFIYSDRTVLRLALTVSALGQVSFGEVRELLTCRARISSIHRVTRGSQSELLVVEPGILHLSLDHGESFITIPHTLGFIRGIDGLQSVRNARLPPFPSDANVLKEETTKDTRKSGETTAKYEYAIGLKNGATVDEALWGEMEDHFLTTPTGGYYYRHYMVCGSGAEVLPYDYSAVLCVILHGGPGTCSTYSIATNVDYIPYTKSSLREPLLCASYREEGTPQVLLVRGNSSGVSFSTDHTRWSPPQKSSPVGIVPADGGSCIIGCQRNTLHHFTTASTANTVVIPSNLRVPSLLTMVASD